MNLNIVDVTEENAQQILFEESAKRLVVVDFWSETCAPCKTLTPVLEALADEYAGQFLLAKVNVDHMAMLAAQFRVRSVPSVFLIKDAQPIDAFVGAKPEPELRALFDQHLPKPWDLELEQALDLIEQESLKEALVLLASAYKSSDQRADIAMVYARTLIAMKRLGEAETVIAAVAMADQGSEYNQVKSQLEIAKESGKAPELQALEEASRKAPDNIDLIVQLSSQYAQNGHITEALESLYSVLKKDVGAQDGEVKKRYLDILNSLEKGDALATQFQRKLFTLLY
jgi:putative thioredoxin